MTVRDLFKMDKLPNFILINNKLCIHNKDYTSIENLYINANNQKDKWVTSNPIKLEDKVQILEVKNNV